MYAVVGCTDCGNLWLLADPDAAETARCSRCGSRHRTGTLRRFFESEDREAAREARSELLARKQDETAAFESLDSVADLERAASEAGVTDEEYLAASGLDPAAVAAAGESAGGGSRSREQLVRAALREQDRPTADQVVEYATERGVPADAARQLLERLYRRGEVSENGGRYRLL